MFLNLESIHVHGQFLFICKLPIFCILACIVECLYNVRARNRGSILHVSVVCKLEITHLVMTSCNYLCILPTSLQKPSSSWKVYIRIPFYSYWLWVISVCGQWILLGNEKKRGRILMTVFGHCFKSVPVYHWFDLMTPKGRKHTTKGIHLGQHI